MRSRCARTRIPAALAASLTALLLVGAEALAQPSGLSPQARKELSDAGVDKYLGTSQAVATPFGDWTKHTFVDANGAPNGPVCIAGTPYSVFTKPGRSDKLLIFLQGGGACWQDFTNCNIFAEAQFPPENAAFLPGIFSTSSPDGSIPNDIGDWSVVYMPYCDGSVFSGDNDVVDPAFPLGPVRFHRGLRNASAGMDVAAAEFAAPEKILITGSSAGGVGASAFAPFLARFLYGNRVELFVLNDAGPVTVDLRPESTQSQADIAARAADWQFGQFYPASCTDCSDTGQATAVIGWRLDNDLTVREAFYETDQDLTNRFFLRLLFDPIFFRTLIVSEHGLLNAAHPDRYKRFIVSGDTSHTALQDTARFYTQDANGVPFHQWTNDFVKPPGNRSVWVDVVEDFVPAP